LRSIQELHPNLPDQLKDGGDNLLNTVLKQDYRQKMLQRVLSATAKSLDASTMSGEFDGLHSPIFPVGLIIGNGTWLNSDLQ
jgi:hypothetical protein